MLLDQRLYFGQNMDIKGRGAVRGGDIIDVRGIERDFAVGDVKLHLVIQVTVAGAGGSLTSFALESATNVSGNFLGGGSRQVVVETAPVSRARLTVGRTVAVPLPMIDIDLNLYHRYLGFRANHTGTYTALSVAAWLNLGPPKLRTFADAVN